MSLIRVISINHDCEFTKEYPSMVQNHIEIITGFTKQMRHIESIRDYVEQLVGIHFYGQTTTDEDSDYATDIIHENLATVMKDMNEYLRYEFPGGFSMTKITNFIKKLSKYRKQTNETTNECFKRLSKDCDRFLNIYLMQDLSEDLDEPHYWGTRQQLLAGKVIADWIDTKNGPMDPIFGAMLTPTAGRVGAGNSSILHGLLFDNDGKFAYHSAVHDGFGYLKSVHDIGPGYDYLNWKILGRSNMFAGQITGLYFWWRAIGHDIHENQSYL